jgi:hypothetical protein
MTSDEIQHYIATKSPIVETRPLWEIAYQLAVMNEQRSKQMDRILEQGDTIQESFQALGSPVGADSDKTVRRGIEGFEPPPAGIFNSHRFVKVRGNRFCGHCGAGEHHAIHTADERTTRPDPQAASIQTRVPDDSSEI